MRFNGGDERSLKDIIITSNMVKLKISKLKQDKAPGDDRITPEFLANVNSRSRSLYAIARPSVVCLSFVCRLSVVCLSYVTFVRPTQAVQIFSNISTALGTLAIHRQTSTENFTEIDPGEPLRRGS